MGLFDTQEKKDIEKFKKQTLGFPKFKSAKEIAHELERFEATQERTIAPKYKNIQKALKFKLKVKKKAVQSIRQRPRNAQGNHLKETGTRMLI